MKKQRQMEQRKELAIWALEDMGWGWAMVWVLMVCPMALASMAAMLVMAHMEYGRDLWVVVPQDQRGPRNLLDLVMDLDMEVMALDMVDLEAMGLAMVDLEAMAMAMVSTVDTFGRDLRRTPPPNQ